jgi:hypothetical protein
VTARDELLASLTAERYTPTPPHRPLPADPPAPAWQVDTPDRTAARRRTLRRETAPGRTPKETR